MIEIEIRGIEEAVRKMGQVGAMETLRPAMLRGLYRLQRRMANYPPAPPRSSYRRTGTLGRRWTTAVPIITASGTNIMGRIGNNTMYGPFVQSAQFQARQHRGRWPTDEQVMREETDAITKDFEATIRAAVP